MKKIVAALIFFLVGISMNWGQDNPVSIKPEKPVYGGKMSVTYNSSSGNAVIKNANEIILYADFIQSDGVTSLCESKMKKNGNIWEGSFEIRDSLAKVILIRFDSGDLTDDNNRNCWSFLIYDRNGKPVQKAHYTMGMLYKYGGLSNGFPVPEDKIKSANEMQIETELFPAQLALQNRFLDLLKTYNDNSSNKEVVEQVVNDIVKIYRKNIADEETVLKVISFLKTINQTDKADELAADYLNHNPNGKFARENRFNNVYRERDKKKRIDLINKYLKETPKLTKDEINRFEYSLVQALIELKRYDETYDLLQKMETQNGVMYNSLAWDAIENGVMIEKAAGWAKIAVDLYRNPDPKAKPANITLKDWKISNQFSLLNSLDTYAFGLYKLGKSIEAEKYYEEILSISRIGLGDDFYTRFILCLNKNGKYNRAVEIAEECIEAGKTNDELFSEYKTAFLKSKGNEEDYKQKLAAFNSKKAIKVKEKLAKQLINMPAPAFSLKGLDGKIINLSDLKGKVIVVDFWATWCTPCIASFPTLQKVYEKYKTNNDIIILAVNTWEKITGGEKENKVMKFIKENNYSFTVLFDLEEREKSFASLFSVEGIPTKFLIDKEGNIQFKTVGFNGEKEMIEEMDIEIDMLLKEEHKAALKK